MPSTDDDIASIQEFITGEFCRRRSDYGRKDSSVAECLSVQEKFNALIAENERLKSALIKIYTEIDWLPEDDWLYLHIEKLLPNVNFK